MLINYQYTGYTNNIDAKCRFLYRPKNIRPKAGLPQGFETDITFGLFLFQSGKDLACILQNQVRLILTGFQDLPGGLAGEHQNAGDARV